MDKRDSQESDGFRPEDGKPAIRVPAELWQPPPEGAALAPQSMWYYKEIHVDKLFPLSRCYALRKSLLWLLIGAAAVLGYAALQRADLLPTSELYLRARPYLAAAFFALLVGKVLYHELYRITYRVKIDGFRLMISRGVFFREQGSLPILPISEIYIRRSFADMLLGLCSVNITTALDQTQRFASIEGLPLQHGQALQQFLSDQLSRQVFLADIPQVNKETGEETFFRKFYTERRRTQ